MFFPSLVCPIRKSCFVATNKMHDNYTVLILPRISPLFCLVIHSIILSATIYYIESQLKLLIYGVNNIVLPIIFLIPGTIYVVFYLIKEV